MPPGSIKDHVWAIISKGRPLFAGISDAALFFQKGLELREFGLGGQGVQPQLLVAAVAMDQLAAAPGAHLDRAPQLMIFSALGMTGRTDILIKLQGLIYGQLT